MITSINGMELNTWQACSGVLILDYRATTQASNGPILEEALNLFLQVALRSVFMQLIGVFGRTSKRVDTAQAHLTSQIGTLLTQCVPKKEVERI